MPMIKLTVAALLMSLSFSLRAAEITTCIIDTSLQSNPVFYYFPISKTKLRCDHIKDKQAISLNDLYANNWRLIQIVSPVKVDREQQETAYTPPVIYLERTVVPEVTVSTGQELPAGNESDDSDSTEDDSIQSSSGSLFNWFKGDSQPEAADQ